MNCAVDHTRAKRASQGERGWDAGGVLVVLGPLLMGCFVARWRIDSEFEPASSLPALSRKLGRFLDNSFGRRVDPITCVRRWHTPGERFRAPAQPNAILARRQPRRCRVPRR